MNCTYELQNVFNLNSHYNETQEIFIKVRRSINLTVNKFSVVWLAGCLYTKGKLQPKKFSKAAVIKYLVKLH